MTDYSRYNSFINKNSKPYSYRHIDNQRNNHKSKWIKKTYTGKETILPGDTVKLLFEDTNKIESYTIVDNYMDTKPKGSNNPKGDIRKQEYIEVPSKIIHTNELSTLSRMYELIKYKHKNDIIKCNNQNVTIIDILKKSI